MKDHGLVVILLLDRPTGIKYGLKSMKRANNQWTSLFFFLLVVANLTPALAQRDSIVQVGGEWDYPPYAYLDKAGNPTGFNVALTRAIAEKMSIEVDIRLGPWGEIRRDLEEGRIDVIQGMYYSPQRDTVVDFSPAFTVVHHTVFARKDTPPIQDLEELAGQSCVVMAGDIMHDHILQQDFETDLTTRSTVLEVLECVSEGQADYALVAQLPGFYWINDKNLTNLEQAGPDLRPSLYCYAVTEGDAALVSVFSEGLAILQRTGEYQKLHHAWLGVLEPGERFSIYDFLRWGLWIVSPLLVIIVLVLAWTLSLRRQVAARTGELEKEARERRRALQTLAEQEALYRDLVESTENVVAVVGPEMRVQFMNQQGMRVFGLSPASMEGMHIRELTHPEDWEATNDNIAACLQTRQHNGELENRVGHHTGTYKRMHWQMHYHYDTDGNFRSMNCVGRDITQQRKDEEEHRKLEDRMRQAQHLESLGVLAGGIAHDFNNLLMSILGNAELIQQDIPRESLAQESLDDIQSASRRAAHLCQQMLAYSGKGRFQVREVHISHSIEEMYSMLEATVKNKGALTLDLQEDLSPVALDVHQFSQSILNLVTNAVEALEDKTGHITVRTRSLKCRQSGFREFLPDSAPPDGTYVMVEVEDDGAGMDRETRKRMFEPFFSTKFTGRGLGLAAVLGILRGHGGGVRVETAPGKGTRVGLFWRPSNKPVQARPGLRPEEGRAVQEDWAPSGHVLVADDEPDMQNLCRKILEKMGFTVDVCGDGAQALQAVREKGARYECVLLDLTMPRMDGAECLEAIRQIYPDLPVVLSSGYSVEVLHEKYKALHPSEFLQKPYTSGMLKRVLRYVLQGGRV